MARQVYRNSRLFRWKRVGQWLPKGPAHLRIVGVDRVYDLWYRPHRGYYCYRCIVRRVGQPDEIRTFDTDWVTMKKVKIATGGPAGGSVHIAPLETTLLAAQHAIVKHMAICRYDDGEARKTGWITIRTQNAQWQVTAKDPDAGAQLVVVGQTLDDALALLDALLSANDAPWEPDPYAKQGRSGRRAA